MILILAPHLEYPAYNGGDQYIDGLGRALSAQEHAVKILGANTFSYFENSKLLKREFFLNEVRPKSVAALRTVALGSHYYVEKFLTPNFIRRAEELLAEDDGGLIICSYLATASIIKAKDARRRVLVLTQNDEVAWFRDQRRHSSNPLLQLVSLASERWAMTFLGIHVHDFVYGHATEADCSAYQQLVPGHRAIIVSPGVEVAAVSESSPGDGKIRLLFTGSLSVKMNYDALLFFQSRFWPALKNRFGQSLEICIAGSRPSRRLRRLCDQEKWKIYPDISDEDLQRLYGWAQFGLLPFPYTTGAKLKLLNCLAAGLPVLATKNMIYLPGQDFFPNLYSDNSEEWIDHIQLFAVKGVGRDERAACRQYVSQYSWQTVAKQMLYALDQLPN